MLNSSTYQPIMSYFNNIIHPTVMSMTITSHNKIKRIKVFALTTIGPVLLKLFKPSTFSIHL